MTSIFTLALQTREDRGCWCRFPPGCWRTPCVSGPRGHIRALARERHQWATASPTSVISEDRRAGHLARIHDELTAARRDLRAEREPAPASVTPVDPWADLLAAHAAA